MMKLISDNKAEQVIQSYEPRIQKKLNVLRLLIIDAAKELAKDKLEETTKWGEPSYLAKKGSTIRIDWKPKNPDQYAIYFKCTSLLVKTFKEIHGDTFKYEKTRAITFQMDDKIPEKKLKSCIKMALQYHKVKHLPLLGM